MPEFGGEGEDLARILGQVEAGNTDLKALGFWKLVSRIKRDPDLTDAFADDAGQVDRLAFERRFRFRPPVWVGNLCLAIATGVGVALLVVILRNAKLARDEDLVFGAGILIVAGGLSVVVHDLAHWVVGRLGGIRFSSYFLDGPFRIQPGIKTDYASYLRADPRARARMHAAGAVASKIAPFAVFVPAYLVHRSHDYTLFPSWSLWALLALGIGQVLTDVVWSTKKSDWKRWRRERRIAADLYSKGTPGSSDAPG